MIVHSLFYWLSILFAKGYLLKHKKRLLTKWHKRFCVLVNEFLFYYKSDTDKKEQGYIILPGYTITVPPKDKGFVFVLENEDKTRDCYAVSDYFNV